MSKTNFVDGDPSRGVPGTVVPADFLNTLNKHYHTGLDQDGHGALPYAADTGAANIYVVTLSPSLTQYVTGMPIYFKATNANTAASTVNVNGLGVKTIKKNIIQDLAAGDIQAGQLVMAIYDGTNFQLIGGMDAHTVDGYHASHTPATNVIPVGAANGRIAWEAKPAFRGALLNISTDETIPNDTASNIVYWNVVYDTNNLNSNPNRWELKIPSGCTKVRLYGGVNWAANSAGYRNIFFAMNGTSFAGTSQLKIMAVTDATITTTMSIASPVIPVVAGDAFTLSLRQTSGGNLSAKATPATYFAIEIIE